MSHVTPQILRFGEDIDIDYAWTEKLRQGKDLWNYFLLVKGGLRSICRLCHQQFTRPGLEGQFNHLRHLKRKHKEQYHQHLVTRSRNNKLTAELLGSLNLAAGAEVGARICLGRIVYMLAKLYL